MNTFDYLQKVFLRLPTYDSAELIAAKKYSPNPHNTSSAMPYDLCSKKMDPFMFGAITPVSDADDLLSSKEVEGKASLIYGHVK